SSQAPSGMMIALYCAKSAVVKALHFWIENTRTVKPISWAIERSFIGNSLLLFRAGLKIRIFLQAASIGLCTIPAAKTKQSKISKRGNFIGNLHPKNCCWFREIITDIGQILVKLRG